MFKVIALTLVLAPIGAAQVKLIGQDPHTDAALPGKVGSRAAAVGQLQRRTPDPTRFATSLLDEAEPDIDVVELSPQSFGALTSGAGGPTVGSLQPAGGITLGSSPSLRIFEVTIHPGGGYTEKFLLAPASPGTQRPLLVGFHKFGVSHADVLVHTSFFREGIQRNWHVIAPLAATTTNFSSLPSQFNVAAVLNWMVNHYQIDKTRVYGVGFSMGAGGAMNFAARHLDPAKVMFAAVVNHTGVVSLEDAYFNEPLAQPILDNWFGNGTPGSATPWNLRVSSVLSMDPITLQVNSDASLARNLMHITTRTYRASNDPTAYLMPQNDLLHSLFLSLGAAPGDHDEFVINGNLHTWDLINEKAICDWLKPKRLRIPTSGNTLADHDGVYFNFIVEQDTAGAFTPFVWNIDNQANTVSLSATSNLKKLSIDTAATGLRNDLPLLVSLATTDGVADQARLRGWNHLPFNVLRDGVATTSWTYDVPTGDLVLLETNGATTHNWQVIP